MQANEVMVAGVRTFAWRPAGQSDPVGPLNFGDELGPILVRSIVDAISDDARAEPVIDRRIMSVGSVLHFAKEGDVVWGSGINGKVMRQPLPLNLDVRSVRGPLTRSVLLSRGIAVPEVYGDPALLSSRLFPELTGSARGGGGVVIIPNLNELDRFPRDEICSPLEDATVIAARIASADLVVATSLHALVLADVLGVPSRPVRSLAEHPFKYIDYYAGTGRPDVRFADSVEDAVGLGGVAEAIVDEEALLAAFPDDLWTATVSAGRAQASFADIRRSGAAQRDAVVVSLGRKPSPEAAQAVTRLDLFGTMHTDRDGISREDAAVLGIELPHMSSRVTRAEVSLSVVMPTHNVGPWIRETLESVLQQDVEGLEVIVVDDHSTDETCSIVDTFVGRDARVRLVRATSRGGGSARNIGADHARGKYIAFCDGDDIVPDGAYAALVRSLERSGSDLAIGDYLKFRPSDTWRPTAGMKAYGQAREGISIEDEPTLLYSRPCWNKVFARDFWESRGLRYPDVPRSNDVVPMVKAYLLARHLDVIEDVVYVYRERPGGSSMTAKADSSASILSYLGQERICAQLVTGTHSSKLAAVYSALIYDRDGYVHVARFVAAWQGGGGRDSEIVDAVRALLDDAPPPPENVSAWKVAVMQLVAAGEIAAARTVVRALSEAGAQDGSRVGDWPELFSALRRHGISLGDVGPSELTAAQLLIAEAGTTDPRVWAERRDAILRVLGPRSMMLVPEASVAMDSLQAVFELRSRAAAAVTAISGGESILVLEGRSAVGGDQMRPVLHDGERGQDLPVVPDRISWEHDGDQGWRWTARFPVASLPLHRPLAPALTTPDGALVASMESHADLPPYSARDAFLYDRFGSVLMVRRRRHWLPRAARRAAIVARARIVR